MKKQDKQIVIFRRDKDGRKEVFALFPTDLASVGYPLRVTCYQHVGQHCAADYVGCISRSIPAKKTELDVKALAKELRQRGYKLDIRTRAPSNYLDLLRKQVEQNNALQRQDSLVE